MPLWGIYDHKEWVKLYRILKHCSNILRVVYFYYFYRILDQYYCDDKFHRLEVYYILHSVYLPQVQLNFNTALKRGFVTNPVIACFEHLYGLSAESYSVRSEAS